MAVMWRKWEVALLFTFFLELLAASLVNLAGETRIALRLRYVCVQHF
jgi:hypothetical protein